MLRINLHDILLDLNDTVKLTTVLLDGGANCDMTSDARRLINAVTSTGSISGWNRNSSLTTTMSIGMYGKLKRVLSVKGCKDIIVPAHARSILGGSQTWIYNSNIDTHCLVLTPFGTDATSSIIAVCSPQTNGIECCTQKLLQLLDIHSYTLTGVEYVFSSNGESLPTARLIVKPSTDVGPSTLKNTSVSTSGDIEQFGVCATFITNIASQIEANHSKFEDRYDSEPLRMLIAMMGGCSLSSLKLFLRNKTMMGLDWITAEMIYAESIRNNYSEVRASFELLRRPPKSLRIHFGLDYIPAGYALMVDAVFWKRKSGSKESTFKTRGGYIGAIFGIDYRTTMPFVVPIKSLSGTAYKKALIKLLKKFTDAIERGHNTTKLKYLIVDQHKTQLRSFLEVILTDFDADLHPARTDTNDMSRLNKTSDTLFRMAHYWCIWGSMPVVDWFWHAFKHAVFIFPYVPKATSGTVAGKGYSPFTQWYGILSNANFFTAALFVCIVAKTRVDDTRGGGDFIFTGVTDTNSAIEIYNPLSNGFRTVTSGIFINMQPPPGRLVMIYSGQPIFDESKLLLGQIVFNIAKPGKTIWFQYQWKPSLSIHNCWIGYDNTTGTNAKPLQCVCGYRARTIVQLSSHLTRELKQDSLVRTGKVLLPNLNLYAYHPDPKRRPPNVLSALQKRIAMRKRNSAYDSKVFKSFASASSSTKGHLTSFGVLTRNETEPCIPTSSVESPTPGIEIMDSGIHTTQPPVPALTAGELDTSATTPGTAIHDLDVIDIEPIETNEPIEAKESDATKPTTPIPHGTRVGTHGSGSTCNSDGKNGDQSGNSGRRVLALDNPTSVSSIPFPSPVPEQKTEQKKNKPTSKKHIRKPTKSILYSDAQAARRKSSMKASKKHREMQRSLDTHEKWLKSVGRREPSQRIRNKPVVACTFDTNKSEEKQSFDSEVNVTDLNDLHYHMFNNLKTLPLIEIIDMNKPDSILAIGWKNVTATTDDEILENIKDAVRHICINTVNEQEIYNALFEVNNTGFVPTSEFWRTNTGSDFAGTRILTEDSPYNEKYGEEIIGTSKFVGTTYKNPVPSTVPSFMPMSFNNMLLKEQAMWETSINSCNYNGDDFIGFEPPECEINQCEAMLRPGVVSGIKFMNSEECRSWLSKLTSANRKGYIPSHSANALKSPLAPFFIEAMMKELASISKLGVFQMKKLPKGKKAIPCRFVFDIKWDAAQDKLVKFKARLVAQGFHQREYNAVLGIGSYDADGISSPVLKLSSLYAITNLAASLPSMVLMTADVGTAFLAACLATDGTEDVFISFPPVCIVEEDGVKIAPQFHGKTKAGKDRKPATIVKLIKALYGLKNSSAAWFRTIRDYLLATGFTQSVEDRCLFSKNTTNGSIMLGIHVDDMLITGQNELVSDFIANLEKYFVDKGSKITKEDASHPQGVQFLGSVIQKHPNGTVTVNQEKRIEDVCDRFNIKTFENGPGLPWEPSNVTAWQQMESMPSTDAEKMNTVISVNKLYNSDVNSYNDVVRHYREYTGNLIWISQACPMVLPIVYKLARYQNNPGILHFRAVRRVLEYLYANRHRSVTFGKQRIEDMTALQFQQHALTVFTDTSHGDCPITKRSTGGYVVFLFGSLLMMRSFRLSCTTTSTTQSEYYMMSAAAAESTYLMELYNNTLLPIVNNVLKTNHANISKVPIVASSLSDPGRNEPTLASSLSEVALLTSKLSLEAITSLNTRTFPMISESNPVPFYGDNMSANSWAKNGGKKNSKHSMIHASWLWDLIHQRRTITVRKIDTKLNPSDITTKQEGMNAAVFEQHTQALLGELDVLPTKLDNVVAHIMVVDTKPVILSLINHKETGHMIGIIHQH